MYWLDVWFFRKHWKVDWEYARYLAGLRRAATRAPKRGRARSHG